MKVCFFLFLVLLQGIAGLPWHNQISQQSEGSNDSPASQMGRQNFPPWFMQCGSEAKADSSLFGIRICLDGKQPLGICYESSMRICCNIENSLQVPGDKFVKVPDQEDIRISFHTTQSVAEDSCFFFPDHGRSIKRCPRSPYGCDATKKVCINNTNTNIPCDDDGCTCKKEYSGADCCECASGYAEVSRGVCASPCPEGQEFINGKCQDAEIEEELTGVIQQFLKWIELCLS